MQCGLLLLPLGVLAQASYTGSDVESIYDSVFGFVNLLITFFILLATAVFLWGIIKYLTAGGDEEKIKEARRMIIWGIVFLAVMVAVWGFVNIVLDFLGLGNADTPDHIPTGPTN